MYKRRKKSLKKPIIWPSYQSTDGSYDDIWPSYGEKERNVLDLGRLLGSEEEDESIRSSGNNSQSESLISSPRDFGPITLPHFSSSESSSPRGNISRSRSSSPPPPFEPFDYSDDIFERTHFRSVNSFDPRKDLPAQELYEESLHRNPDYYSHFKTPGFLISGLMQDAIKHHPQPFQVPTHTPKVPLLDYSDIHTEVREAPFYPADYLARSVYRSDEKKKKKEKEKENVKIKRKYRLDVINNPEYHSQVAKGKKRYLLESDTMKALGKWPFPVGLALAPDVESKKVTDWREEQYFRHRNELTRYDGDYEMPRYEIPTGKRASESRYYLSPELESLLSSPAFISSTKKSSILSSYKRPRPPGRRKPTVYGSSAYNMDKIFSQYTIPSSSNSYPTMSSQYSRESSHAPYDYNAHAAQVKNPFHKRYDPNVNQFHTEIYEPFTKYYQGFFEQAMESETDIIFPKEIQSSENVLMGPEAGEIYISLSNPFYGVKPPSPPPPPPTPLHPGAAMLAKRHKLKRNKDPMMNRQMEGMAHSLPKTLRKPKMPSQLRHHYVSREERRSEKGGKKAQNPKMVYEGYIEPTWGHQPMYHIVSRRGKGQPRKKYRKRKSERDTSYYRSLNEKWISSENLEDYL